MAVKLALCVLSTALLSCGVCADVLPLVLWHGMGAFPFVLLVAGGHTNSWHSVGVTSCSAIYTGLCSQLVIAVLLCV